MEYMNNNNAALVDYTLIPVNGQYVATKPGEEYFWADPNIEIAANHMQRIISDKEWREELINNGKNTAKKYFNVNIMGNIIRKRLKAMDLYNG
jgi:hypothetical protein